VSGGSGVAGLAVTALVAALVAAGVAALLPASPPSTPPAGGGLPAADVTRALREDVATLRAEVAEIRAARAAPPRAPGGAPPPSGDAVPPGTGPAPPAGTDPLPASRAELEALIDERIAGAGPAAAAKAAEAAKKRLTVEEAGAEIGLSTLEIDAARRVYRNAESELLLALLGTTDLEAIKEEVRAAKDDPEKKAALVNKCVGNLFRNLGHVMTIEDRRDRELRKVLPEEQAKRLKGYDLKPTFEDVELESVLKDVFGD